MIIIGEEPAELKIHKVFNFQMNVSISISIGAVKITDLLRFASVTYLHRHSN